MLTIAVGHPSHFLCFVTVSRFLCPVSASCGFSFCVGWCRVHRVAPRATDLLLQRGLGDMGCRGQARDPRGDAGAGRYAQAQVRYGDIVGEARVNLARRRTPKRHVTIKYLEDDFAQLFVRALGGLVPDGTADVGYRGRELARNAAIAGLALASGLRRQEFSYLLVYEVPALPPQPGRYGEVMALLSRSNTVTRGPPSIQTHVTTAPRRSPRSPGTPPAPVGFTLLPLPRFSPAGPRWGSGARGPSPVAAVTGSGSGAHASRSCRAVLPGDHS